MARTKTTRAKKPLNPWDIAQTWEVIRGNQFEPPSQLEPGVKFFVEMLEQLDCTTISSCEGHPGGFYILFTGQERTVREIAACGYLTIEVERTPGNYRLSSVHQSRQCRPGFQASPCRPTSPGCASCARPGSRSYDPVPSPSGWQRHRHLHGLVWGLPG
jgi:hypothetical protein